MRYEAEVILMEECAELIQCLSKIQRTNGQQKWVDAMAEELADVAALSVYVQQKYGISREDMIAGIDKKINKLKQWSTLYDN